jgi:hypothetical protein
MRCANPKCSVELVYLRGGSVQLLELESLPSVSSDGEDYEFSIQPSPRRFFWLCDECSHTFVVRHWTPLGVILEPRNSPIGKMSSIGFQDGVRRRAA